MPIKNLFKRTSRVQPLPPPDNPGDLPRPHVPGQQIGSDEIRDLRELIQKRYALDLEIWEGRNLGAWDRDLVESAMRKSDAVLIKIQRILSSWNDPYIVWAPQDYAKMQEIRQRLELSGKRNWSVNPPWYDE
jgi:hypothetical protein